jgi:hypothetical protein
MFPQFLRIMGSAVIAVGASACSPDGLEEPVAEQRQAISGGSQTGARREPVLFVTSEVRNLGGNPLVKIGSGTLVAPNLVMTALHVVSRNASNTPFSCDTQGNPGDGSGAQLGGTVPPEKVAVSGGPEPGDEPLAYGALIVSSGSTTICQNDLAFIVLDRALELPTYAIRRGTPASPGDDVTVVGYGAAPDEEPGTSVVRTERAVTVAAVGQWIRTFTVTEGPCEGDSGGPALSSTDELVGVFSSVSVDCTGPNAAPKYTDLGYFASLVEEAFEAADAGSPWSTPTGASGAPAGQAGAPSNEAGAGGAVALEPPAGDSGSACCQVGRSENGGMGGWLLGAILVRRQVRRRRRRVAGQDSRRARPQVVPHVSMDSGRMRLLER